MDSKDIRDLNKIYMEAVYGGGKKEEPKDTRMVVTAADKKANTKAYQNMKAGNKAYKPADHLKDNYEFARHKASVISRGGRLEDAVESWNQKMAHKESMKSVNEKKVVNAKDTYDTISSIVNTEEYGKNSYSKKVMGYQKGGMVGKKKKHGCASKVKHEEFGIGNPVKGMHDLDESGNVAHYDVLFDHGVEKNVSVSALEIIDEAMHEHVIRDNDGQEVLDESEVDSYIDTIQKIKRQEAEEDIKRWTALEESGNFTAEEMQTIKEQDIADLLARLEKKRISKGGNPDDSPLGKKVGRAMKSKQDEVRKKAGM